MRPELTQTVTVETEWRGGFRGLQEQKHSKHLVSDPVKLRDRGGGEIAPSSWLQ